jgi:ubiquitin-protein ligase
MHESPRIRRLRNDSTALHRLSSESSVFQFQATGNPPYHYSITFKGKGLWRDRGKVKISHMHRVEIKLGASYPRTLPEIRWLTPIYHPNISEIGMVCLGGYGTHWVPSIQLDELCTMLWDMVRYHNYDIRSPYNRDAALWVANQVAILFPTDPRPLRDLRVAQGRIDSENGNGVEKGHGTGDERGKSRWRGRRSGAPQSPDVDLQSAVTRVRLFIERYGRVFGEGLFPEPGPVLTTSTVEQPAPAASPAVVPALPTNDSEQPAVQTLLSEVECESPDDVGLILLEEAAESLAAPQQPRSIDEEIRFID